LKIENPYFEKYAKKLAAAQQTSPEEFLTKLENQKKKEEPKEKNRAYTELLNPKDPRKMGKMNEVPHKQLKDIMKTELLEGKSAEEIKQIWLQYHQKKDVIAAVIPTQIFNTLIENAKKFPIFIFPVPRSQGYEFIMFQFSANTVHFTPLLCYQVR
jgi:ATP synthase mitochondrial F1 complex assembly factor 1